MEFPAFVFFGVYSPANRDESRDDFRLGFLEVLDARIRNLVAAGKRVFLTGDLNISREELDAANAEASMRKQGLTGLEFVSTPARRLFNQLLEGGKVLGDRDEGRENPIMWDICRAFHPNRKGMFTCWEQKINARPGNCGARIDYVLCSLAMKGWFCSSNIQEGLMVRLPCVQRFIANKGQGSDHCPVYAVIKDRITIDGKEHDTRDVMNPPGMFYEGKRQREYSATIDPLPLSGKLIPEFFGRRNIRDMFARKPSIAQSQSSGVTKNEVEDCSLKATTEDSPNVKQVTASPKLLRSTAPRMSAIPLSSPTAAGKRRVASETSSSKTLKRAKSGSAAAGENGAIDKGQRSLKGFFKPKVAANVVAIGAAEGQELLQTGMDNNTIGQDLQSFVDTVDMCRVPEPCTETGDISNPVNTSRGTENDFHTEVMAATPTRQDTTHDGDNVHDPVESKESWSKLFTKPAAPRCEGHGEPCITLLTKKQGMNLGRSFWMCPRPLGPSGAKEKKTQWRCQTFIWCSDWNANAANTSWYE